MRSACQDVIYIDCVEVIWKCRRKLVERFSVEMIEA